MAERHIIDMETWSRRGHYRYFGKLVPHEDRLLMTVSVELNHGLADARHVSQFFGVLDMV